MPEWCADDFTHASSSIHASGDQSRCMDGVSHEKARPRCEPRPGCHGYGNGNGLAATAATIVRRRARRARRMVVAAHGNDAGAEHRMTAVVVECDVRLDPCRSTARAMVADIAATAATSFSSRSSKKRNKGDSQEDDRLFHDVEFRFSHFDAAPRQLFKVDLANAGPG